MQSSDRSAISKARIRIRLFLANLTKFVDFSLLPFALPPAAPGGISNGRERETLCHCRHPDVGFCFEENITRMGHYLAHVKHRFPWVDMVLFSELAAFGPNPLLAETLPGAAEERLCQLAARHGVADTRLAV
jgi:hypothetical protein